MFRVSLVNQGYTSLASQACIPFPVSALLKFFSAEQSPRVSTKDKIINVGLYPSLLATWFGGKKRASVTTLAPGSPFGPLCTAGAQADVSTGQDPRAPSPQLARCRFASQAAHSSWPVQVADTS